MSKSNWQSIELAPTDGTELLVWCRYPKGGGFQVVAKFSSDGWWETSWDGDVIPRPRYWQELPEAPSRTILAKEKDR